MVGIYAQISLCSVNFFLELELSVGLFNVN